MKKIVNKNVKKWFILALSFDFLIIYIILAFFIVVVLKNSVSAMAPFVIYYLPLIWIGILVVTYQRYCIIKGTYKPKPKIFATRRNLFILYTVIGIILIFNLKEFLSSKQFGSDFAAMALVVWLIIWYGFGSLLLSDYIFEKFLKKVISNAIEIDVSIWFILIIILLILIAAGVIIPIYLAVIGV